MENKNFQDITQKSYVPLAAGYGIEGAFPIDLRTVLPGTTMLEALIHRGMAYEGMLVYFLGTGKVHICVPKFHSAIWSANGDIAASKDKYYTDEQLTQPVTDGTADGTTVYSNWLWHEEWQVESTQSETAIEAGRLNHTVVINGKATDFSLPQGADYTTIDTGLFTPETIAAGTDIDTITHCGFYSYTDANESANNYSLLIEKIGDKLYRTKISIENGVPVIETSVQIGQSGDTVVWDSWQRLATGKSITTATSQNLHASSVGGNHVALDIKIGSTPELWVYSDSSAQYPSGYANIHTADGQVFTIGSQSAIIEHPFLIKLVNDNGTRTASVESLKGSNSKFGMVKLNDAINSDSGVGAGVAATPSAVKSVQANLTNHESVKGNASNFGHVKLSDATNSDSAASANVAATPKAVKDAVAAEATARANAVSSEATARQSADAGKVDKETGKGLSSNDFTAAYKQKLDRMPVGMIVMWSGSSVPTGWALCDGTNGTPDLRDRFIVGSGSGYSIGDKGGASYVTLTTAQMPIHSHRAPVAADRKGYPNGSADTSEGTAANESYWRGNKDVSTSVAYRDTDVTGQGQSHENRPPFYALAFIMFKG